MMRFWLAVTVVALTLPFGDTRARPTFEGLWAKATKDAGCIPQDHSNFVLVTCKAKLTLWYFTKPSHPAHPGVIKRFVEQRDGAVFTREEGSSFASDSAQPAFKAWLAQIVELDRQMKMAFEKEHGRKSGGAGK